MGGNPADELAVRDRPPPEFIAASLERPRMPRARARENRRRAAAYSAPGPARSASRSFYIYGVAALASEAWRASAGERDAAARALLCAARLAAAPEEQVGSGPPARPGPPRGRASGGARPLA